MIIKFYFFLCGQFQKSRHLLPIMQIAWQHILNSVEIYRRILQASENSMRICVSVTTTSTAGALLADAGTIAGALWRRDAANQFIGTSLVKSKLPPPGLYKYTKE